MQSKWKSLCPGGIPIKLFKVRSRALRPTRCLPSARPAVTPRQIPCATHELLWDLNRRHWGTNWEWELVSSAAATSGAAGTCSHTDAACRAPGPNYIAYLSACVSVLQASLTCVLSCFYVTWIGSLIIGSATRSVWKTKQPLFNNYDITSDVYWAAYLQSIQYRPNWEKKPVT